MSEQEKIELTEEDLRQAKLVEYMRQHAGYPVLIEFWAAQREAILSAGKKTARGNETDARFYWGALHGFDLACSMPEKIANRTTQGDEIDQLEKEGAQVANQ